MYDTVGGNYLALYATVGGNYQTHQEVILELEELLIIRVIGEGGLYLNHTLRVQHYYIIISLPGPTALHGWQDHLLVAFCWELHSE